MIPLTLSTSLSREIEREGVKAYPNECCGILVGRDLDGSRIVEKIVPMKNEFDSSEQHHRFAIDPLALAAADDQAARDGQMVIGFFHSHPDHPAKPSEYDRTHVPPWSFYSHVIVAIEKGKPQAMTCWRFNEESEQFDEQKIRCIS